MHNKTKGCRPESAVARALLADKQVILLGEPPARLGHEEGYELLAELCRTLAGRTVAMATQDQQPAQGCESHVQLNNQPLAMVN